MMASIRDSGDLYSAFLSLPTELRCHIYDYLLSEAQAVTISAGYVTIFGNRVQDRKRKHDIPGLPLDLAPLVRPHFDASLLSIAKPPEIAIDNDCTGDFQDEDRVQGMPAPMALELTCRQVNDELTDYMRARQQIKTARAPSLSAGVQGEDRNTDTNNTNDDQEGLSLYVTYPYGVLVLKNIYPYLLKQAKRVYISGYYKSPSRPASPCSPTADSDVSERLTPSNSFAVSNSFPSSFPSFRRRRPTHPTRTSRVENPTPRPRLRLDPPIQRQTTLPNPCFPAFTEETSNAAPTVLTHLVRTLLPSTVTSLSKLTVRLVYPGEDSYSTVWSDTNSPVTHILRSVHGGQIEMKVKRGALGTGLILGVKPKPDGRVVSTSWENWKRRAVSVRERQQGQRVGVRDLDAFLQGIEV